MLTATTAPGPLVVTTRPPHEAYDYPYFHARLADTTILKHAVAIQVFRAPLLAIPVGGSRRGGYISVDLLTIGLAIRQVLDGRPGFPDLRVRWCPYRDTCHVVEWGSEPPDGDVERGRFYGYSDHAIADFLAQRRPADRVITRTRRLIGESTCAAQRDDAVRPTLPPPSIWEAHR
ncbi:hypothetical protein SUDANB105_00641 [Streptomyces sp. enrichment culture]|uniref:DUF6302 family protein n=1 Tax=Streptomyces sp. enrichment culture TaxID=1795815 RepID=UPI003F565731